MQEHRGPVSEEDEFTGSEEELLFVFQGCNKYNPRVVLLTLT